MYVLPISFLCSILTRDLWVEKWIVILLKEVVIQKSNLTQSSSKQNP